MRRLQNTDRRQLEQSDNRQRPEGCTGLVRPTLKSELPLMHIRGVGRDPRHDHRAHPPHPHIGIGATSHDGPPRRPPLPRAIGQQLPSTTNCPVKIASSARHPSAPRPAGCARSGLGPAARRGRRTAITSGRPGPSGRPQGRLPHPGPPRTRSPETLGPRGHTRRPAELTRRSAMSSRDPAGVQRATNDDRGLSVRSSSRNPGHGRTNGGDPNSGRPRLTWRFANSPGPR